MERFQALSSCKGSEKNCLKKKMLRNSGKKYYLCDKSKFGRVGFVKLADFSDINVFITDCEDVEAQLGTKLADADVKVINI